MMVGRRGCCMLQKGAKLCQELILFGKTDFLPRHRTNIQFPSQYTKLNDGHALQRFQRRQGAAVRSLSDFCRRFGGRLRRKRLRIRLLTRWAGNVLQSAAIRRLPCGLRVRPRGKGRGRFIFHPIACGRRGVGGRRRKNCLQLRMRSWDHMDADQFTHTLRRGRARVRCGRAP